jgi:hypothetical protein
MTNAARRGAALPALEGRTGHSISTPASPSPASKITPQRYHQQGGGDRAVRLIAARYALTFDHAKTVVRLAGIGCTGAD